MGKAQRRKRQARLDGKSTPVSQTKAKPDTRWLDYLIYALLVVGILAVFWRVTGFALINYDDGTYVTENHDLRLGLTGKGIRWALTAVVSNNWHPLTLISYLLNYQIGRFDPQGYHLLNLLLHMANSLLLFLVLNKMTGFRWRSAFAAALFAIHPFHVESVAWVAERKDVLSGLFWMLTMWAYINYTKRPGIKSYLPVVLAFALGLMSKPMLVTLPLALLLLDFWPLGRFSADSDKRRAFSNYRKLLWEKAPLFGLSAVSSIITFVVQRRGGSVADFETYPIGVRIANAVVSYVRYIGKTFWPQKLAVFYPHPGDSLPLWQVMGSGLLLVCITYLLIRAARRYPYAAVGWLWYVITLAPVIGIVQVGAQAMADRYTYVTLIGIFIAVAWGIPELLWKADASARGCRHPRVLISGAAGIAILALMYCAYVQVGYWRNNITLFRHALNATSNNFLANLNLASALQLGERPNEAIGYYRQALQIAPGNPDALSNIGLALADVGKAEEGLKYLYKALEVKPNDPDVENNLGYALCKLGRFDEGEAYFKKALQTNPRHKKALPNYVAGLNNKAIRLAQRGNPAAAVKIFSEALRLDPGNAETHYNLGVALDSLGRTDEAIEHFSEAVRLNPDNARAHNNLGALYAQQKKLDEAIRHFAEAVRIAPDFQAARSNLEKFSALKRAEQ